MCLLIFSAVPSPPISAACDALASRIVARSHLKAVAREGMEQHTLHHLTVAGIKKEATPPDAQALTAIHQGAGGLFRKANHLARGALIAAAAKKANTLISHMAKNR